MHPLILREIALRRAERVVGLKLPRWVVTKLITQRELTEEEAFRLRVWLRSRGVV